MTNLKWQEIVILDDVLHPILWQWATFEIQDFAKRTYFWSQLFLLQHLPSSNDFIVCNKYFSFFQDISISSTLVMWKIDLNIITCQVWIALFHIFPKNWGWLSDWGVMKCQTYVILKVQMYLLAANEIKVAFQYYLQTRLSQCFQKLTYKDPLDPGRVVSA